ncbi:hypothetical protein V6D40_04365 [Corynebacterium sp. Q4381]|uniref:hypothetical protein n=1 Tax=Corynebacterium sp. Marseille-Q4381 TaxID=3121597 RepID=UPI002FE6105F
MSNPYDNRPNEWDSPSSAPRDYPPTQQFPPQQHQTPYQASPYAQQAPYSYGDWQPAGWQAEPEKKPKSNAPLWVALGVAIAAALGAGGYFAYRAVDAGQAEPITSTVVVTSTSPVASAPAGGSSASAATQASEPTRSRAEEEREAAKNKEFAPGKSETSVTSPEFSAVVGEDFAAYYRQHGQAPATLESKSPVTGKTYTMTCFKASGGYRCTGGNNASVFIGER